MFIGPTPDADARLRPEAHGARAGRSRQACRCVPGIGSACATSSTRASEAAAHRLSGDAEEHGRRRRHRHAAASDRADELAPMFERVERLARNNFKDAGIFLEKYVDARRHIEVQIFGDGRGSVIALGERDCSAQRRNQKVIEETPAPNLPDATRAALWETAARLGQSGELRAAPARSSSSTTRRRTSSTSSKSTRACRSSTASPKRSPASISSNGWCAQAAGEMPPLDQARIKPNGASIQVRLYAEDPGRDFRPSSGLLTEVAWPTDTRIETWVESGSEVSPFYDPMLAKIIVNGRDASRSACETAGGARRDRDRRA